jgi:PST family polysaccharide transporter
MEKLKAFLFRNTSPQQTIAKNTLWLFVGEIVGRLLKLVIVVFATRRLGVEGWGIFSYGLAFVSFFYVLGDFGINTFLTREMAKDNASKTRYLATAFIVKMGLLVLFFLASIIIGPHVGKIALSTTSIIVFSTFFIFESLREFGLAINRSLEKLEREGFSKILINILITLSGVLLILKNAVPLSLAIAYMFGSIVTTIYVFWSIRNEFKGLTWTFSKEHFKTLYAFSWPLIIIGLFSFLFSIDSIMLGQMKSATEVGLYAASQRLVQFLVIIPSFIANATCPLLAKRSDDTESLGALFGKILRIVLALALPLTIGGLFFGKEIVTLVLGSAYSAAIPVFMILMLTTLASFPNILLTNLIFSKNLQKIFIVASSVGVVVNIGLNLWLIPAYGAMGAAISTVAGSVLIMSMNWLRMKRYVPFHALAGMQTIILGNIVMIAGMLACVYLHVYFFLSILIAIVLYGTVLYARKEASLMQIVQLIQKQ